jgi:hypothetical protein
VLASGKYFSLQCISTNNTHFRPVNKEELFNLRHASARNVIERIFGVMKRRFRILLVSPEYKIAIQARIPAALCALHNYIRIHDPDEEPLPHRAVFNDNPTHQGQPAQGGPDVTDPMVEDDVVDDVSANVFRDRMAAEMWEDYQNILHERNLVDITHSLDIDEDPEDIEDIDQYYGSEDDNESDA